MSDRNAVERIRRDLKSGKKVRAADMAVLLAHLDDAEQRLKEYEERLSLGVVREASRAHRAEVERDALRDLLREVATDLRLDEEDMSRVAIIDKIRARLREQA